MILLVYYVARSNQSNKSICIFNQFDFTLTLANQIHASHNQCQGQTRTIYLVTHLRFHQIFDIIVQSSQERVHSTRYWLHTPYSRTSKGHNIAKKTEDSLLSLVQTNRHLKFGILPGKDKVDCIDLTYLLLRNNT